MVRLRDRGMAEWPTNMDHLSCDQKVAGPILVQSYAEISHPKPPETTRFRAGGDGRSEVQKCKNPVFHGVFEVPPPRLERGTL